MSVPSAAALASGGSSDPDVHEGRIILGDGNRQIRLGLDFQEYILSPTTTGFNLEGDVYYRYLKVCGGPCTYTVNVYAPIGVLIPFTLTEIHRNATAEVQLVGASGTDCPNPTCGG